MTVFIEIIQRIGCDRTIDGAKTEQAAGCGGFGKVNFWTVTILRLHGNL